MMVLYRFTQFLVNKYPGKITGISGLGSDCRIGFTNDASLEDMEIINLERSSFDWSVEDPDFVKFSSSIMNSLQLTRAIRANVSLQLPLWQKAIDEGNMEICASDWSEMKAEGWLTEEAITYIEALAKDCNFPISGNK